MDILSIIIFIIVAALSAWFIFHQGIRIGILVGLEWRKKNTPMLVYFETSANTFIARECIGNIFLTQQETVVKCVETLKAKFPDNRIVIFPKETYEQLL